MKIKSDFVTNSSSCCFVLIGFKILNNIENEEKIEKFDNFFKDIKDCYFGFGDEGGAPTEDDIIIGRILIDHLDDYFEYTELELKIDPSDIIKIANYFGVSNDKIKYICGRRSC